MLYSLCNGVERKSDTKIGVTLATMDSQILLLIKLFTPGKTNKTRLWNQTNLRYQSEIFSCRNYLWSPCYVRMHQWIRTITSQTWITWKIAAEVHSASTVTTWMLAHLFYRQFQSLCRAQFFRVFQLWTSYYPTLQQLQVGNLIDIRFLPGWMS